MLNLKKDIYQKLSPAAHRFLVVFFIKLEITKEKVVLDTATILAIKSLFRTKYELLQWAEMLQHRNLVFVFLSNQV